MTPTVIEISKNANFNSKMFFIIGFIIVIILIGFVYYYRQKYIITENVLSYEQNDIRNMATIPRDSNSNIPRQSNMTPLSKESDANTRYFNLNEEIDKI